jgi:hypothetical protein
MLEIPGEFWELTGIDDLVEGTKELYALHQIESVDLIRIEEYLDSHNESGGFV